MRWQRMGIECVLSCFMDQKLKIKLIYGLRETRHKPLEKCRKRFAPIECTVPSVFAYCQFGFRTGYFIKQGHGLLGVGIHVDERAVRFEAVFAGTGVEEVALLPDGGSVFQRCQLMGYVAGIHPDGRGEDPYGTEYIGVGESAIQGDESAE